MAIRKQVEEMEDVAEVMVNGKHTTFKGGKVMATKNFAVQVQNAPTIKTLAKVGKLVSDELAGVDVKGLLRKMGALKEDAPVVPKDIDWGNPETLEKVWNGAQKGFIPDVWKGLKTEELNDKLQRLVKTIRNPKKEEPVKKQVVKESNFGADEGKQAFKVTDKRRRVVVEEVSQSKARQIVEEEPMEEAEEFDEAPVVAKDTARDVKKARRKNMDSKSKVVQRSQEMKAQMEAMSNASALASLSQFKPKEDEDKVFTGLTLETQRNGKSKVIFRGGASKFLRPIRMIFGDGMDIVATDEETVEFMQSIQNEIINIIKRNQ